VLECCVEGLEVPPAFWDEQPRCAPKAATQPPRVGRVYKAPLENLGEIVACVGESQRQLFEGERSRVHRKAERTLT
jgi:hypothetical protein